MPSHNLHNTYFSKKIIIKLTKIEFGLKKLSKWKIPAQILFYDSRSIKFFPVIETVPFILFSFL